MKPGGQELLLCFESKHIIFIMQAGPVWEGQSHTAAQEYISVPPANSENITVNLT